MKKKETVRTLLFHILALAVILSILPAMILRIQAAEISTITVTSSNLSAPKLGSLIVLPAFTAEEGTSVKVDEYGWTCDGNDAYEGEPFTPGTWRIYACATIDKGVSADIFTADPALIVDGENWTFSETFSDEYFHYAIFYKEYAALTSPIIVSGDPTIPETIRNTIIDDLKLADYVSGGTAPYTYSRISGPAWLNLDANTGVISGTAPDAIGYNDDLYVLITDADGQKGVAIVTVQQTKPDLREAVYEISAKGTSPGDLVKEGDALQPIAFTGLDPAYVSLDSSRDSWQKYDAETGTWISQEFGTVFTAGTYRYRVYMSADRSKYSFVHPDFYLETEEDVWDSAWTLDYYDSFDTWAYYYSDTYIVAETIDTVTITGIQYPMDGIGASTGEITVKEDGVLTADEFWYNKTDDVTMADGDPFAAGKEYKIKMTLYANEGYTFAEESELRIKVNGLTPTTIQWIDEGEVAIECDMPMAVPTSSLYVVTAGALNIRDAASYQSDRVGGLKYGDLVQAKSIQGEWVMFEHDGLDAYVNWNYMALTYTEETAIYPVKYTITAGALNVRSTPYIPSSSESDNRIGSYTAGKEVLVTGRVTNSYGENWLVVDYPGDDGHVVGFIMEKYATGEEGSVVSESESAEVDDDSTDLNVHTDGGVPAKVTISLKSAVAFGNEVNLAPEHFTVNEDGSCSVRIYPSDAMNFTNLNTANIVLPAGLGLEIEETVLNADGSIEMMLSPVAYSFSKGKDGTWTKGSSDGFDLTVSRSVNDTKTFDLFVSVEVDGAAVDPSNYTASSGSLNASLKASYLQTLSAGSHTIRVSFEDGSAETTLTVKDAVPEENGSGTDQSSDTAKDDHGSGSNQSGSTVNTGDPNNPGLYGGLLLMSLLMIAGVLCFRRRHME